MYLRMQDLQYSKIMIPVIHAGESGNIVVILLTIAYVIYSFYKKSRKMSKPEQATVPEGEEQPSKKMGDWFEEVFSEKDSGEVKPEPEGTYPWTRHQQPLESRKDPEPFLDEELKMYKGGEYADAPVVASPQENTILQEEDSEVSATHQYEWRRAVIYAEILNKRYS